MNIDNLKNILKINGDKWDFLKDQVHPFFAYSQDELIANVHRQKKVWGTLSANAKIFFAVKSNPNLAILNILRDSVDGFDISSQAEFQLLTLGNKISEQRITCSGPAKSDTFLTSLIQHDIYCLHLDSFDEYKFVKGSKISKSIRICNEESFSQKVGIPDEDILKILELAQPKEFRGFHVYIGREQFSVEKFKWAMAKMQSFYQKKPEVFGKAVQVYFGAGLSGDEQMDIDELKTFIPTGWNINLEAGRAIVQSAGVYATRILSIKTEGDKKRIIIDGGLQHMATHLGSPRAGTSHVSALCFRGSQLIHDETTNYSICGSLSLWNDILLPECSLPKKLQRNDWIAFHPIGAYGWTAGSNQFIGPSKINEFILSGNQMLLASPPYLKSYLESFL